MLKNLNEFRPEPSYLFPFCNMLIFYAFPLLTLQAFSNLMQRNVKNKITFFTFGLLAGITVGVVFGVAIKALFSHLNDLHISLSKIGSKEDQISQRLDSLEGKVANQNKKSTVVVMPSVKQPNVKPATTQVNEDSKKSKDSTMAWKKYSDKKDSVSVTAIGGDEDSNIVIMTNQLVGVSNVSLTSLDTTKAKKNVAESDSILASMNNVEQDKEPISYRIEFWESPLNIKGYKMSRGKLVLYGINSKAFIKLLKWNEGYYLLADQVAYKVDYTDDFHPFEKVADKAVLKKLL